MTRPSEDADFRRPKGAAFRAMEPYEAVKDETAMVHVCKRLRTKMYYVLGRDHVDLHEPSPTAQYWCALTATVLGPDDMYCSPRVCQPHRACFEEE